MAYPQIDIYDTDADDWETCDILGVGSADGTTLIPVEILNLDSTGPANITSAASKVVDFENQTYGTIFNVHSGATIGTSYAHSGTYGVRLVPDPSTGIASLTSSGGSFPSGYPWVSFSMWFRLVTLPPSSDTYMNLFEIGNTVPAAPKSQFTVFFNNNTIMTDFNNTETMQVAPSIDTNWHHIEARVCFGSTSYIAYIRYDGDTPITHISPENKTPATASVLWIHYPDVAVDYTMDVDDILLSTGSTDQGWLTAS